MGADRGEDGGGDDNNEENINNDPSPPGTVLEVSPNGNGTGSSFCTVQMTRLTVWCVHTSV